MIGTNLSYVVMTIGSFLHLAGFVWLGIGLFSLFVLFTLVTLPVEFDASRRAVIALQEIGVITPQEVPGTGAVLRAAAMTYVAAAVSAILQLVYFLIRSGLLGGNRNS
jgi:Zn-dependent membrane protease YugP